MRVTAVDMQLNNTDWSFIKYNQFDWVYVNFLLVEYKIKINRIVNYSL
jgi:hypothetical protein